MNIEAMNHAALHIPAISVRMHVCGAITKSAPLRTAARRQIDPRFQGQAERDLVLGPPPASMRSRMDPVRDREAARRQGADPGGIEHENRTSSVCTRAHCAAHRAMRGWSVRELHGGPRLRTATGSGSAVDPMCCGPSFGTRRGARIAVRRNFWKIRGRTPEKWEPFFRPASRRRQRRQRSVYDASCLWSAMGALIVPRLMGADTALPAEEPSRHEGRGPDDSRHGLGRTPRAYRGQIRNRIPSVTDAPRARGRAPALTACRGTACRAALLLVDTEYDQSRCEPVALAPNSPRRRLSNVGISPIPRSR